MKNNIINFEDYIRNQLTKYELPYNHNDWVKFEKVLSTNKTGLKTSNKFSKFLFENKLRAISTAGVIILAVVSYFYFSNINTEPTSKNEIEAVNEQSTAKNEVKSVEKNHQSPHTVNNIMKKQNIGVSSSLPDNNIKENDNKPDLPASSEDKNEIKFIQDNNPDSVKQLTAETNLADNLAAPNSSFTVDIKEGCSPLKVNFIPNEKSDNIVYLWDFGDGEFSTELSPVHTYNQPGVYNVSLTVKYFKSEKPGSNVVKNLIIVKSTPVTEFSWKLSENNYTFSNLSQNADNYKWIFGDSKFSTEENPQHTFMLNGSYTVKLISSNSNGCSAPHSKVIDVIIEHKYFVPNAFTPDSDGQNDTFGPTGNDLTNYEFRMLIYDKYSRIVFESNDVNNHWDGKIIGTNKLAESGIYVWKIITKDKYENINKKMGYVSLINN